VGNGDLVCEYAKRQERPALGVGLRWAVFFAADFTELYRYIEYPAIYRKERVDRAPAGRAAADETADQTKAPASGKEIAALLESPLPRRVGAGRDRGDPERPPRADPHRRPRLSDGAGAPAAVRGRARQVCQSQMAPGEPRPSARCRQPSCWSRSRAGRRCAPVPTPPDPATPSPPARSAGRPRSPRASGNARSRVREAPLDRALLQIEAEAGLHAAGGLDCSSSRRSRGWPARCALRRARPAPWRWWARPGLLINPCRGC